MARKSKTLNISLKLHKVKRGYYVKIGKIKTNLGVIKNERQTFRVDNAFFG